MAENRLPIVDGDDGVWGEIVNQFIEKEHYNTGTDNAANGGHKTITIRPGTTGAGTAPLKFTSGPLMTSSEVGAMEFNNDKLHFTVTTGAVRKTIALYDDTSGATGDIYYRSSGGEFTRLAAGSNGDFLKVASGLPSWGAAGLTKSDVGLGNVDNTSDVNKPLSTATQSALLTLGYSSQQKKFYPHLRGWNAALAGRADAPARVVLVGDSLLQLHGQKIANRLNSLYNATGNSDFHRPGANLWQPWTTFTGSTADNDHGLGSLGGTLTGTQEGTLNVYCDGFILSYDVQQSGGADMEVYIDNVLQTTINTTDAGISGSIESGRLWTSAALSYASHTLKILRTGTGSVKIGGVLYTNGNLTKGVQVWNAGHSGYAASNLIADPSTRQAVNTLDPALIIIQTGINDHGTGADTTTESVFEADLTTVVQNFKADNPLASILLVSQYSAANFTDWEEWTQVVKNVALNEDVAYADNYMAMGLIGSVGGDPYDLGSGDNIHPTTKGGQLMSSTIVDAIISPAAFDESPALRADGSVRAGLITAAGVVADYGANGSLGFGAIFNYPIFVGYRAVGDANSEFGIYSGGVAAFLGYPSLTMLFGAGGATALDATFYRSAASEMTIGGPTFGTYGNIVTSLIRKNAGTPESVVTAPVGAIAQDTTNGKLYVKETGTGNTGWKKISSTTISTFIEGLLDDADASAARTTLGLGTGATTNISVGTSAPGSPATGDLWVDTN